MSRVNYYTDGFEQHQLADTKLSDVLQEIHFNELKSGYKWEQKYANTFDMRPDVHSYNDEFVEALFKADIDSVLEDYVANDIVLTHVQVRKSFAGPSYMDWHRDTYKYGNRVVGNIPPVQKVIFYPLIDGRKEKKLKLAVGTHHIKRDSYSQDIEEVKKSNVVEYESSNDTCLIFDTSIMHAVIPDTSDEGSIRIIYSFMRKQQFNESLANIDIHSRQVELYESVRRKYRHG